MRKTILFLIIICLGVSPLLLAQTSSTGANFLKIGVGPRPVGLGSAFTGVGDDVYTLYWNPAGIGFIRRWELSAMYNNYFADMYYGAITGVKQFRILGSRKTAFGIGLFYHGMPDWDATEGRVEGPVDRGAANNMLALLSFGQRMDWLLNNLSVGINAKIGYSKLMNHYAATFATDLGLMYRFDLLNNQLTLGVTAQNIGIQTAFIEQKSPIPLGFRFGASYRILFCPWHHILLATDVAKYKYGDYKVGFGAEYWFHGIIGFRGGYNYAKDDLGDISFGASVRFDAFNSGLQTDYAQTDFGNVFEYDHKGAISIHAVNPEPFRLFEPDDRQKYCYTKKNDTLKSIIFVWEESEDPDPCDKVNYRIIIDPDNDRILKALSKVAKSPEKISNIFCDELTDATMIPLSGFKPDTYYWTVIAIDKGRHTRWCNEIRSFEVSAPDLRIKVLAFTPSNILPELDDNYQGTISIEVENSSSCAAYNFDVVLSDSYHCELQNVPVDTFHIDSIGAYKTVPKTIRWHTDMIGKHQFKAIVDPDSNVFELNEQNNKNSCTAVTIPRGRILAENDTLDTKKIEYTYCEIPIVPVVFFDSLSTVVHWDFYKANWIYPYPILKVIADRLKQNETLKINLAGYIDPHGEKGQKDLAYNRMKQVKSIFVDSLEVSSEKVDLLKNYDIIKLRVDRTPERKVNEENRRVEIIFDDKDKFKLFHPIKMDEKQMMENERITNGLAFNSELKAYTDITFSQLIITDPATGETIFRTPFNNYPTYDKIGTKGGIVWIGRNTEQRLVQLNHSYAYHIKIQDKLGREFTSIPKEIYLKCTSIVSLQKQHLEVHLKKFDSAEEYFSVNDDRLKELAEELCQSPSLKIKFRGYACEIGDDEYNINLAYIRSENVRERFLKMLKLKYEQSENQYESWNELESRVIENLSKQELKQKYEGYPGAFNEPIKYYRPCILGEILCSSNDAYIRNLNRRVDVILFTEKVYEDVAKDR